MITSLGSGRFSLEIKQASDPLLSEARVVADAVGFYWDELTSDGCGDHVVQAMTVRDLFRSGIRHMHDSLLRATTEQNETSIMLNEHQLRWLGEAVTSFAKQKSQNDAPYDLMAQQVTHELSLKVQENLAE